MNKVIDVEWRSAKDTVGIVLTENDMGQKTARIGTRHYEFASYALIVYPYTEAEDAQYIAENGARLSFKEAQAFFPYLKPEEYKYD